MKELEVFLRKNELNVVNIILFYPKNYVSTEFNFLIKKDFKIKPYISQHGYFLDLKNKKILNLKQFKIENI